MENSALTEEELDLLETVKKEFASTAIDILNKQNEIIDDAIGQLVRKNYKLGSLDVVTEEGGLVQAVYHNREKLFESRVFVAETVDDEEDIHVEITGTWFGKESGHA